MYVLAEKMKSDLEKAINRRNLKYALEAVQLALSIFGGFLSFKGAMAGDSPNKFGGAQAILGGAQGVFYNSYYCLNRYLKTLANH